MAKNLARELEESGWLDEEQKRWDRHFRERKGIRESLFDSNPFFSKPVKRKKKARR